MPALQVEWASVHGLTHISTSLRLRLGLHEPHRYLRGGGDNATCGYLGFERVVLLRVLVAYGVSNHKQSAAAEGACGITPRCGKGLLQSEVFLSSEDGMLFTHIERPATTRPSSTAWQRASKQLSLTWIIVRFKLQAGMQSGKPTCSAVSNYHQQQRLHHHRFHLSQEESTIGRKAADKSALRADVCEHNDCKKAAHLSAGAVTCDTIGVLRSNACTISTVGYKSLLEGLVKQREHVCACRRYAMNVNAACKYPCGVLLGKWVS